MSNNYPIETDYKAVMQHPGLAFIGNGLDDLRTGDVAKIPPANKIISSSSGNFAIVFKLTTRSRKVYAIRCFKKISSNLEERYRAIDAKLKSLPSNSHYFVDFKFFPNNVQVSGKKAAPFVKMEWADGQPLNKFLEKNYRNTDMTQNLDSAFRELAFFLETNGIAHGDIQPENIMVANDGKQIQLIDYDGMYTSAIHHLGPCESGKPHFQHPQRKGKWGSHLDRFSFILFHLVFQALIVDSTLWEKTNSSNDMIILKKTDFEYPVNSKMLQQTLQKYSELEAKTRLFIEMCNRDFEKLFTLEEFIAKAPNLASLSGGSSPVMPGVTPSGSSPVMPGATPSGTAPVMPGATPSGTAPVIPGASQLPIILLLIILIFVPFIVETSSKKNGSGPPPQPPISPDCHTTTIPALLGKKIPTFKKESCHALCFAGITDRESCKKWAELCEAGVANKKLFYEELKDTGLESFVVNELTDSVCKIKMRGN